MTLQWIFACYCVYLFQGPAHTTQEEFKTEVSLSRKAHQIFYDHTDYAGTHRRRHRFRKALFSKCFSSTIKKRKAGVSELLRLVACFHAPFS